MKTVTFERVNVFTDQRFSGNPLVVIPEASGLEDQEMQAIAKEMGTSETTFVFPPEVKEATYKMRIFTPLQEIPFAGHPSLGTAYVMAALDRFPLSEPVTIINQEIKVGVLPLELYVRDGEVEEVIMTQKETQLGSCLTEIEEIASVLGLDKSIIESTGLDVAVISTGIFQLFIPLPDLQTIKALRPKFMEMRELEKKLGVFGFCVFTLKTTNPEAHAHMRFFSPILGVREDPATGSAAGGLGSYLALRGLAPQGKFIIEQGEEIGRPSKISVEVKIDKMGHPYRVKVGGQVTSAMEGRVFV